MTEESNCKSDGNDLGQLDSLLDAVREPALTLNRRRFLGGLTSMGAGILLTPLSAAAQSLTKPALVGESLPLTYTLVQEIEGTLTGGPAAAPGQDGPSISATYPTNNTVGNLLVAVISRTVAPNKNHNAGANVAPTVGRVSDTAGNRWKQVCEGLASAPFPSGLGLGHGVDMWYCETPTGGVAPTVTAQVEGYPTNPITAMQIQLLEYSGCNGFELVDTIGVSNVGGSAVTAATVDACAAHDLLVTTLVGDCSAATAPRGFASRLSDASAGLWVADRVDSGSAGEQAATWTDLRGVTTGYCLIAAFRRVGPTQGPRCWQTSYTEPALSNTGNHKYWTSRPYPVDPAPGNTLIAIIQPYAGVAAEGVRDTAGNTWELAADAGRDRVSGVDTSIWVCRTCRGGHTALTAAMNAPEWGGCAFMLLEYSGLTLFSRVDRESSVTNFTPTSRPSLSTPGPTRLDDFVLGWLNGSYWFFDGITKAQGWRQRFTDSAGSAGLVELPSSSKGVQTTSWTLGQAQAGDIMIVALRRTSG